MDLNGKTLKMLILPSLILRVIVIQKGFLLFF